VELDPAYAPALTNLGQMPWIGARRRGPGPTARRRSGFNQYGALHHNLGNALRQLDGATSRRGPLIWKLTVGTQSGQAHATSGYPDWREGQTNDASPGLKRAASSTRADATFQEFLAELYMERDEYAEGGPHWERALELSKEERASTHLSLGWALQEDGRRGRGRRNTSGRASAPAALPVLNSISEDCSKKKAISIKRDAFPRALACSRFRTAARSTGHTPRGQAPHTDFTALEGRLTDPQLAKNCAPGCCSALAHVLDARATTRAQPIPFASPTPYHRTQKGPP